MDVSFLLDFMEKLNTTIPEDERANLLDLLLEATFESNKLPGWARLVILLFALIGLIGNSIVLWVLGFRTQRNPFSVYILNLATADSLFLLCLIASIIAFWVGANIIFVVTPFVTTASYSVGLSLLTTISTERCLSVLFPIWYRCHRPKHTSAILCAVLWALPVLCSVVNFLIFFYISDYISRHTFFMIQVIYFCSQIPLLCVSSLTLLLRVWCSSQRHQPPRFYRLVLLTVLVFLLCGVPLGIMDITMRWGLNYVPTWLPFLLASVNSSANPFIYFFLGKLQHWKKKEPFREVLMRSLGNEAEIGGDGERQFPTPTP